MRTVRRAVTAAAVIVVGYLAVTGAQVWQAARGDDARPAEAIVVLGAAQYDGRPSPALRARLDHAAALYHDGVAPVVWVTGGRQPGDRFSEASASDLYLQRREVPKSALRLETQGVSTYESLTAAARLLRKGGARDVLLVSDPWHSYRITAIAREAGLRPHVSPAEADGVSGSALRRLARETVAVSLGRLVGYRRLTWLDEQLLSGGATR
ncbi:MAG: YdcF family protein [Actinomycetota bacterium]|nr:YdcF family protein [Actinomycetota bacterium]